MKLTPILGNHIWNAILLIWHDMPNLLLTLYYLLGLIRMHISIRRRFYLGIWFSATNMGMPLIRVNIIQEKFTSMWHRDKWCDNITTQIALFFTSTVCRGGVGTHLTSRVLNCNIVHCYLENKNTQSFLFEIHIVLAFDMEPTKLSYYPLKLSTKVGLLTSLGICDCYSSTRLVVSILSVQTWAMRRKSKAHDWNTYTLSILPIVNIRKYIMSKLISQAWESNLWSSNCMYGL